MFVRFYYKNCIPIIEADFKGMFSIVRKFDQ